METEKIVAVSTATVRQSSDRAYVCQVPNGYRIRRYGWCGPVRVSVELALADDGAWRD